MTTSSAHLTPPVDTQDEEAKVEPENGEDIDDEEGSDDESESESASQPVAASPRIRDTDYDDDAAQLGGMGLGSRVGLGAGKATPNDISVPQEEKPKVGGRGGIGSGSRGRGGIGLAGREAGPSDRSSTPSTEHKGGIGSSDAPPNPIAEHAPAPEQPLAFGRRSAMKDAGGASRPQQAFQGLQPRQSTVTPTPLTAKEAAHFRDMNIQSNFGARYLANLGWNAGEGLGVNKDGRAVPIEAGKVLKGEGIQAGVRTEDSKREARRRGEVFSDDEDEQPKRRGRNGTQAGPSRAPAQADQSWKKQKKVKVKVEHKSYEQLLAEAGDAAGAGIGLVLDARGGEVSPSSALMYTALIHREQLKEVQSLSSLSLSSWTPTSDNTQLPELRHNLRLILDVSKADVDALAREGKSVNERRRWALREEEKTRRKIDETSRREQRISSFY